MSHDASLFRSTAHYYAMYRPVYPAVMFDDIAAYFGLSDSWPGKGALLDLGCGTGEMALPMARYFENVYAWDPDADMLIETRRNARAVLTPRQLRKIITAQKSSDDLASATRQTFKGGRSGLRLAAMGQSFHWMDKPAVLGQLFRLIRPGGGLVIVSGISDIGQNPLSIKKDLLIHETVRKYLGPKRRAGASFYDNSEESYQDLLASAGFSDPRETIYEYILPRTVDQVVGYLFSLSWASKYQFGDDAKAFEIEIRSGLNSLLAEAGVERFNDQVGFSCFMAGRVA